MAFETALAGVCKRRDFTECDPDEEPDVEIPVGRARWTACEGSLPANDVSIVEGRQLRYGTKVAWAAARRY